MPLVSLFPLYRQQRLRKGCSPREKKWGSEKVLEEGYSQYAQLDMFRLNEKREKKKTTKISKLRVKWSWNCFLRNLRRKILEKLAGLFFFFTKNICLFKS